MKKARISRDGVVKKPSDLAVENPVIIEQLDEVPSQFKTEVIARVRKRFNDAADKKFLKEMGIENGND